MFVALRGGEEKTSDSNPVVASSGPKLNLNDTVPAVDTAAPVTKPDVVAKAPVQPVVSSKPAKLIAGYSESPRVIPMELPSDVRDRVRRSAVHIRTYEGGGASEGSGWFAEPGIVVTNAHVVGMLEKESPPPFSVKVFLYRGTKEEHGVTAKLLAVDRENDLAVLRVSDKNLPDPMPIGPSSEISEGLQLHVVGYPAGTMLAAVDTSANDQAVTTLSIRNTAVAGRVQFKGGGVRYIQLEGGADHGNSGGAIIDNAGFVRCVLDAGRPGTNMRFGIPVEFAVNLLQGRITKVKPGQAYKAGSGIRQPLLAKVVDPLNRIKGISMEMWAGDKSTQIRPASDTKPSPLQGDSPRAEATMDYKPEQQVKLGDARVANGELDLPTLREGQVYWIQPKYERSDGTVRWGEGIMADFCGLAVDKVSANLATHHEAGRNSNIFMQSSFGQTLLTEGRRPRSAGRELKVTLPEKMRQIESDGSAMMQWTYKDVGPVEDEQREYATDVYKDLNDAAHGSKIEGELTKMGLVRNAKSNAFDVPRRYKAALTAFNNQMIQALEGSAAPLPEKEVQANEEWYVDLPVKIVMTKDKSENIIYRRVFKYLGKRNRDGRDEAVIVYEGWIVKGDSGNGEAVIKSTKPDEVNEEFERQKGVFGHSEGAVLLDLKSGVPTMAQGETSLLVAFTTKPDPQQQPDEDDDDEDPAPGGQQQDPNREIQNIYLVGSETKLQRAFGENAQRVKVGYFLPNQAFNLLPFVGAPDSARLERETAETSSDSVPSIGMTGTSGLTMPKEVLDRIKKQACLVHCIRSDGGVSAAGVIDGTGWLAEPGIVVTCANVVGMNSKAARPPLSVECYFDAGTPNARQIHAKILTVDTANDLCILKLESTAGLPEPMAIVPSTDLYESQRMFVLGFPLGTILKGTFGMDPLSLQLKIRNSSVSGRTENQNTGLLKYIRVEGGVSYGNFGGPIVDMNGAVRCLARSVTSSRISDKHVISMCIPSEYAQRLLWGYPLETNPKLPYFAEGSVAKLPVEVKFGDPMNKVKKVWLEYWTGEPKYIGVKRPFSEDEVRMPMPRRSSATKPEAWPNDSERKSVDCTYDSEKMLAKGEFVLPEIDPGYAYWIQPRYIDATGQEKWGEAVFYAPEGGPVKREAVELKTKFRAGSGHKIEVDTSADYRYIIYGVDRGQTMTLSTTLSEKMLGLDPPTKLQGVEYRFENILFGYPKSRTELIKLLLAGVQNPGVLMQQFRTIIMRAGYTSDGMLTKALVDTTRVNSPIKAIVFSQFCDQVLEAVQLMSIKFPNRVVKYGESWEQPLSLHIETRKKSEPAMYKLNLTYVGKRERSGRSEAIVEIHGSVARDDASKTIDLKTKDEEEAKDKDEGAAQSMLQLFQAPKAPGGGKPKESPKAPAPKEKPKGGDDKGKGDKDKDKEKDEPAPAGSKKPLYGVVRGLAYIDIESGIVTMCRMYLDIDTEIVIKDPQTKVDAPVQAGGTIEMKLIRHVGDR
ncbi:MAG: trypsin-like peptidase domain-containing protein [Gemmataceae bacterium]